jgi:hypothetical protein
MAGPTDILSTIQNGVSAANTLNSIITGATANSSSLRVTISSTIFLTSVSTYGFLTDAPSDGKYYGRLNGGWSQVLSDAPSDGNAYGRLSGAWSTVLASSGGTLTGFLTLNADPTANLQAATKQYVDNRTPAGAWRLLNTLTASGSSTIQDTTSLSTTYAEYEIVITELVPATNNATLFLQIHSGGTYKSSGGYFSASWTVTNIGGTAVLTATTGILISAGNTVVNSAPGLSGVIRCYNPSANQITHWTGQATSFRSGLTNNDIVYSGGAYSSAGVVDGFQITSSAGNLTSGTVKVYGR